MRGLRLLRGRLDRARAEAERGAAATVVALLVGGGVALGMAALTVDVGALYAERRQVQNGADAAALAVANDCASTATCPASPNGLARTMADGNATDGTTAVALVCGAGDPALPGCPGQSGPQLTRCPAPPTNVNGWVRVRTSTRTTGGSTLLPPSFARGLTGNAGSAGTQVLACAQAAWGLPANLAATVPIAISVCEWAAATNNGTVYAPASPFWWQGLVFEQALELHDTDDDGTCPGFGGAYADLPGGFGWLASNGCVAEVGTNGLVDVDPGVGAGGTCRDTLRDNVNSLIYLPVFDDAQGNGATGYYHVSGYAAFYLTGYTIPGASGSPDPPYNPLNRCTGSRRCIYGWFTQAILPENPSGIVAGPDRGATVVQLTG
jgi:Flp pilus assembly protein TadG